MAILSDTSTEEVQVLGGRLFGDRSAVFHIGQNQLFGFDWVDVYFAANVMLYRYVQTRHSLGCCFLDTLGNC